MGFQREQRDRIHQHIYRINKNPTMEEEAEAASACQTLQSTTFSFQHTPSRTSPVAVDLTHHHTSEFMKEALKDAVLDFEQCLRGTTKTQYNSTFPRGPEGQGHAANPSELRDRIEKLYHRSNSSISSISTSSSALPYATSLSPSEAALAGLPSSVPPR